MIHIQIATVPATCISWSHRIARFPSKFELCFHYSYADLDYSSVHGFVVLRIIQAATSQLFWMIINDKHMCFSSFLLLFLSSLLRIILFVILSGEHSSRGDVVGLLPSLFTESDSWLYNGKRGSILTTHSLLVFLSR